MAVELPADRALAKVRFLIVDDNAAMRGLIRAVLAAFGCDYVFEAADAKRALGILAVEQIDILITDWKMSPVDGLSLVRHLRDPEKSANPFIPIIMLTAYAEPSRVRAARDAGVTEFLAKPFSAEQLFKRVQVIVNRPRPFVRTKAFFGPDRRRVTNEYEGPERREDAAL
ncbi:response regulator [Glycocaulis sp.]|uniref:response regulator n=1 Tax=Glycocaulis sp. TaxID=1969725 RepID=UPI0025B8D665|nr:response regulator [Glycocaulis sp.]MCH8521624.1 response regulator [Glycocaulis sp.]